MRLTGFHSSVFVDLFSNLLQCFMPKSKNRRGKRKGTSSPPKLLSNITNTHVFRFISTGAFAGNITDSLLFGVVGAVSATATAAYSVAQNVKLESVEIWAPPATQGSLVTVSLTWPNSGQNPAIESTDTTGSVSRMAHIYAKPPKMSLSGFWTAGTGNTVFTLNIPTASIIDVKLRWVQGDSAAAATHQLVTVGATVGALTYGYLDSLTDAGALLKPTGLVPGP